MTISTLLRLSTLSNRFTVPQLLKSLKWPKCPRSRQVQKKARTPRHRNQGNLQRQATSLHRRKNLKSKRNRITIQLSQSRWSSMNLQAVIHPVHREVNRKFWRLRMPNLTWATWPRWTNLNMNLTKNKRFWIIAWFHLKAANTWGIR